MKKIARTLLVSTMLTACATQETVHKEVKALQTGPSVQPHKSITNFASGLRCMDNMMIEYGVRDISMLVEDLADQTGKINAGTKDMLITAVSDMTRRSRSVKLISFGNDSGNLIAFLGAAGSQAPYSVVPQYDIRGSISQLDSSVVREQIGGSIAADNWGLGASASTAGSILGVDLSVLRTSDLSVIPGVVSSNAVVLFKSGLGADTDATIKKTGISFDFQVAKNEATVQALRNLIELASIELIGRLVKVPYWQCVDIPDDSPEIVREMEDWYFAMRAHDELDAYVRSLLIARGHYPVDQGDERQALQIGIERFQSVHGLETKGYIDYATFEALLTGSQATDDQPPASIAAPVTEGAGDAEDPVPAADANKAAEPIGLELRTLSGRDRFSPGEKISIIASVSRPAYIYCYYADAEGEIQRFFPNRFTPDNFLAADVQLELPGAMPFDIMANSEGLSESITCFASARTLYHDLPPALLSTDFEALPVESIEEVRNGFSLASQGEVADASLAVDI
ncbi:DUF4384 domain-containing protein [Allohahella marinimesophila]|uniref:DUF4384 domain-containing protein n=1 Tax=Allohahella marinimesophila TaxID=1054972 RepID=A0ABP7PH32_9GAMM